MTIEDKLRNAGYTVRVIDYNEIEIDAPSDKVREVLDRDDMMFVTVMSRWGKTRIKEIVHGGLNGPNSY